MNLLIIDDSSKMRKLLRKMFENKFDNIYECEDGSEATDAYSRCMPVYVLMDVQMKVMDGISATKELIKNYPDAKVVIITVYNDATKDIAFKAGAYAFVKKDNLMELYDVLK